MDDELSEQVQQDPAQPAAGAEGGVPSGTVVIRRRRSMWEDPVVRAMGWIGALVLIGFLLTVAVALYYGFIGTESAPRTYTERDITGWESAVQQPDVSADQYQSYVLALITDRQYDKARSVIDEVNANKKIDQSRGFQMLYTLGELQKAESDTDDALKTFESVMKKTDAAYKKEYEKGGEFQNWAVSYGRHANYYLSALGRGIIYRDRKEYEQALKMFDIYIANYPREAEILVDRGDLRAETGDKKGAEADYREALRFINDHERALAGLKKIGAEE